MHRSLESAMLPMCVAPYQWRLPQVADATYFVRSRQASLPDAGQVGAARRATRTVLAHSCAALL